MQRWQEHKEQKLAELLRTNRSFLKMQATWATLGSKNVLLSPGHCAYARQKAAMYGKRAGRAQALIKGIGYGDLLKPDANIVHHVQRERDAEAELIASAMSTMV